MKLNTVALLLVALPAMASFGCQQPQRTYSADPVYARVVDADTDKPIQGVAVVAYWELYQGSITGDGMPCGAVNVAEAVTDKDGSFRIPGWGPVKGACGRMRNGNPLVYFFKPGYVHIRKAGGVGLDFTKPVSVAQVDWNGETIKLQQYQNMDLNSHAVGSYENDFSLLNGDLANFIVNMPAECNWRKIPNMLRAIIAQRTLFNKAGNHNIDSIDIDLTRRDQDQFMQKMAPECGSPRAFIEGLEK
ncbi:MAG TPA: hypothetical protein VJR90_05755 [Gammaproteobacteria bacterium]|nr:hypothetical protein [Gammaproteobacteria bacterium]